MKIISRHAAHRHQVNEQGFTVINGLRFTNQDGDIASERPVSPRETELFVGADGYSFYHDDGTYSGESVKTRATLTATPAQDAPLSSSEEFLVRAVADGTMTAEGLRSMGVQNVDRIVAHAEKLTPQDTQKDATQTQDTPPAGDEQPQSTADTPWTNTGWRPEAGDTPREEWTVDQLKAYLGKNTVEFNPRDNKTALYARAQETHTAKSSQ